MIEKWRGLGMEKDIGVVVGEVKGEEGVKGGGGIIGKGKCRSMEMVVGVKGMEKVSDMKGVEVCS